MAAWLGHRGRCPLFPSPVLPMHKYKNASDLVKVVKFNISGNFLEISRNISKSLEVIMSTILIRIADIPGSRAKSKLCIFLNTMHGELFVNCQDRAYCSHFAMVDLETYD